MGDPARHRRAEAALVRAFLEGAGYVRVPNQERREALGPRYYRVYKKGWEVRLLARDVDELAAIRRWALEAGFVPGRPFAKGSRICQPIYGREQVARFLSLVGARGARTSS